MIIVHADANARPWDLAPKLHEGTVSGSRGPFR